MKFDWVILYVESINAAPTGRCTRVRYSGGRKISEEKIMVPVEELLGKPRE
jgi:hypothetical protein